MRLSRRALLAAHVMTVAPLLMAASPAELATSPIDRLSLPWWRRRHQEKLAEAASRRIDLVWLGDSITENWEVAGPPAWRDFAPIWNRFYGDRNALNLGFSGDTTASLLWRLRNGEVDHMSPRAAVILIGANNFGRLHWPAEPTFAGIQAAVDETRRRLPRTGLILLSVLPSDRSDWVTDNTVAVNRMLAAAYGRRGGPVTYIDVTNIFVHNGRTDRGQFYDPLLPTPDKPLHPTAQAQEQIAMAIEPTLAIMMGDRNKLANAR